MRDLAVLSLCGLLSACSAPSASYERSLRAWLRAPADAHGSRSDDLRAMLAEPSPFPGVRLAAAHHRRHEGQAADADALLDDEAAAFPTAATLLAAYRRLYDLGPGKQGAPQRPARGVAIVVVVDRTQHPDTRADFLATAERPLRERGYYVVPVEVAEDLLVELGEDVASLSRGIVTPATLHRLADIGVDTCFTIDVVDFWVHDVLAVETARHEVWYRLLDTATGEVRWERAAIGLYERREPVVTFPGDDETFFYPSSLGAVFTDAIDFARTLTRSVVRTAPPPR